MKRIAPIVLLLMAASPAAAQDIALSQILIDGQGWKAETKKIEELFEKRRVVAAANGFLYSIDEEQPMRIYAKSPTETFLHKLPELVRRPAGIALWPDRHTLVVGDAEGKHLWALRIEKDGSLTCGDRYYALRVKPGQAASGVTALTVDSKGLLCACTPLGVQVFDPTGRMCGVVHNPDGKTPTAIAFGGPERDILYVLSGDNIYGRKVQAKGAAPGEKKP